MNKASENVLVGLLENLSPDVGVIKLTKTMLAVSYTHLTLPTKA